MMMLVGRRQQLTRRTMIGPDGEMGCKSKGEVVC